MTDLTRKQLVIWLLSGCFLIFSMVVVGGITRLTGSGLSITEWNVVMGAIPPLDAQQWQEAFGKYKATPQFQKLNYNFTLAEFKSIFFWEYLHRLIGRLIGVVFILPFIYFIWKRNLNHEWLRKSLFLFALGGFQGFLGWRMVQSGLTDRTSVSPYWLATHLTAAFITFGFSLWFALQLINQRITNENRINESNAPLTHVNHDSLIRTKFVIRWSWILGLVILQIIYGAFVAGLHAGKIANTFPTMDGEWIPSGINAMSPLYMNLFENPLTVQFIHRLLAMTIVILIAILWLQSRKQIFLKNQKRSATLCFMAVIIQFFLGLFTLLYKAPVTLAAFHQIGGFLLYSSVIAAMFFFRREQVHIKA